MCLFSRTSSHHFPFLPKISKSHQEKDEFTNIFIIFAPNNLLNMITANYDRPLVSFDWAIKKLLRNKADHVIVEGFLTSLLGKKIKLSHLNESEANKETFDDKYNRVDVFCETEEGELLLSIITIDDLNDYIHRLTINSAIELPNEKPYNQISKVYSINIVYFNLGEGNDFVYHGETEFVSLNQDSQKLKLTEKEFDIYQIKNSKIKPEYYILKVRNFNQTPNSPLEEWISFLKTDYIPNNFTAPGLQEAISSLAFRNMTAREQKIYLMDQELKRNNLSGMETSIYKGFRQGKAEAFKIGQQQTQINIAKNLKSLGTMTYEQISAVTGLSIDEINNI